MRHRRIQLAALAAVVFLVSSCAKGPAAVSRRAPAIPLLEFELSANARKSLANAPKDWAKGDLVHEGLRMRNVALRLKGQRTLRSLDQTPSIKLRMDKGSQHRGRTLLGGSSWVLDNMVEDPSMMRAHVAYTLATMVGLPAPSSRYIRVRIDGQDKGIYLLTEAFDDAFMHRHFDSANGPLYEGEYGCDVVPGATDCFDLESGDDPQRMHLLALAERAASPGDGLWNGEQPPFAVEHLAMVLAFGIYVGDFDGYFHAHNYRLYRSPIDGRWHMILSGLDRVFSKRLDPHSGEGVLTKQCFADARCRDAYSAAWEQIAKSATELDLDGIARRLSLAMPKSETQNIMMQSKQLQSYIRKQPVALGAPQ